MFSIISRTNFAIWITSNLSYANAFKMDWTKILSSGKGLIRLRNLSWVQFCRWQIQCCSKHKFVFHRVENIGKGENVRLAAFLRCWKMLSKSFGSHHYMARKSWTIKVVLLKPHLICYHLFKWESMTCCYLIKWLTLEPELTFTKWQDFGPKQI